ncbi:MAG: hypothetical protein ACK5HP_03865 [Bacilli bacterium]
MKKIFILVIILFGIDKVKAEVVLDIDYQENIYANKVENGFVHSGKFGLVFLNGASVYCLDPYKLIGSTYNEDNSINDLSFDELRYTSLVSYFGYHLNNDIYYYMASQELIWENISKQDVYWTTKKNDGSLIDIEVFKNNILNKIDNYYLLPSFNSEIITGNYYEVVQLVDTNNVLENYEIINAGLNEVWINGNTLNIKILSSHLTDIKLVRKENSGISKFYSGNSNEQRLADLRLQSFIESHIYVKATNDYSSKIMIERYDKELNTKITGKFKFKIQNFSTGEFFSINDINEFETDDNGNFYSEFYLPSGDYQIINTSVPNGYFSPNNTIFIILEQEKYSEFYKINDYVKEVKGVIQIERFFNMSYLDTKAEDIKILAKRYEVYAEEDVKDLIGNIIYYKNQLVEIIIPNNYIVISSRLPLGKYYILEKELSSNYIPLVDKVIFNLEYIDLTIDTVFEYKIIKSSYDYLNLNINTNLQTKDGIVLLDGIEYGLYATTDLCFNDYCIFKKNDLIYKYNSNYQGIQQLPYGTYYLKELYNFEIYEIDNSLYYFEYNASNSTLNYNFMKEKPYGKLSVLVVDQFNNNLSNVKLNIYDKHYSYLFSKFSGKNGLVEIADFEMGHYLLKVDEELFYRSFSFTNNDTYFIKVVINKEEKVNVENKNDKEEIEINVENKITELIAYPNTSDKKDITLFLLIFSLIYYAKKKN